MKGEAAWGRGRSLVFGECSVCGPSEATLCWGDSGRPRQVMGGACCKGTLAGLPAPGAEFWSLGPL